MKSIIYFILTEVLGAAAVFILLWFLIAALFLFGGGQ